VSVPRGSVAGLVAVGAVIVTHAVVVRAAAEGEVAHALLGAGNAPPPLGAAAIAVSVVVLRLLAIVVVPGAIAALVARLAAHRSPWRRIAAGRSGAFRARARAPGSR
jgi:hypothetical protein